MVLSYSLQPSAYRLRRSPASYYRVDDLLSAKCPEGLAATVGYGVLVGDIDDEALLAVGS